MTANAWQVFDVFYEQLGNELHDLNATDTLKMGLVLSAWTPNLTTDVTWATVDANEHANGNGYTTGGVTITNAAWTASGNTLTFDCDDATWTASGGSIVARYAVIYNSSAGAVNDLICYCLLDNTPANVTATDGNAFTVEMNASGIFTIAQA